jgi:hypothetical protein
MLRTHQRIRDVREVRRYLYHRRGPQDYTADKTRTAPSACYMQSHPASLIVAPPGPGGGVHRQAPASQRAPTQQSFNHGGVCRTEGSGSPANRWTTVVRAM